VAAPSVSEIVQRFTADIGPKITVVCIAGATSLGTLGAALWATSDRCRENIEHSASNLNIDLSPQTVVEALITVDADIKTPTQDWEPIWAADKVFLDDNSINAWATVPERTGNFLVRTDGTGVTTAFFWPRLPCWRRAPGWRSGEISFLELAGFFLVSDAEDERAVASGDIDHAHLWRVLVSISDEEAFAFCGGWATANADPA
jgi:hypothetical protein